MDNLQIFTHKPLTVCAKHNYHSKLCPDKAIDKKKVDISFLQKNGNCQKCIEEIEKTDM